MRFSWTNYSRAYGIHIVARDYPAARSVLEECITDDAIVPGQKASLLQSIGMTYFLENNLAQSLRYYALGEQAGGGSLRPYLNAAKFFTEWMKDYDSAIAKCDEVIRLATSSPTEKTEDEQSSEYYIAKANELKQLCYEKKAAA